MREGWEIRKLGDLTEVITKGTTPTSVGFKFEDEGVNFVKIESITSTGNFIVNKFAHISNKANETLKRSQLTEGDILFSIAGALGRTAIVSKDILPANTNQALSIIRLKNDQNVLKEYILLALTSGYALEQIEKFKGGVAQQNLSLEQMKNFQIPIPPLQEQKQIVAILDQASEAIDQAKANIEKNIANAKELFQSKLNTIFSQKGEGWEEKSLKEVCEIRPPKKISKEKLSDDDLVSFVPMKYLVVNQMYFNSFETNTLKEVYSGYTYFEDGDVVLAKITPCFENGKLGIAKGLENGIGFGSSEYVVYRTDKAKISAEYLYFFLNRENFRIKGKGLMSGAVGHKRIQPDFYENELINLPDIDNQNIIINKIANLQNDLIEIKLHYNQKLNNLEDLKKSILQKAFTGELTNKETTSLQQAAEPTASYSKN